MSSRIPHLSETSLYVDDLEASKAFYQRMFGLNVTLEEAGMAGLALPGGSVLLLFLRDGASAAVPPGGTFNFDGSGRHHLCFEVPAETLADWERHLMVNGVVIESQIRVGQGISLYFRDPDGHSLEMAARGFL